jgi:hypothetical protein
MPGYVDNLVQYFGVATQGETSAADINLLDGSSAAIIRFPGGGTVMEFGSITTEAWDVAGANANVIQLHKNTVEGGSFAAISGAQITHPKTAGAAASAVGVRNVCSNGPFTIKPGESIKMVCSQAASDAGGAFIPYVIVRMDGFRGANAAAPVVSYSS